MTTRTMKTPGFSLSDGLDRFAREIGRAISAIAASSSALHDYERLNTYSNAALAREGLSRDAIARAVFERNFR